MPNQNQTDINQSQQQGSNPSFPFPSQADLPPLPPEFQSETPPAPVFSNVGPPPKKKYGGGRIIATILGILVLVGGVGAGIFLVSQRQLFQQKAAGGPYCNGVCADGSSCRINGCKTANSVKVEMIRYHCDTISPGGCNGQEVGRSYTDSMAFQESCGSEQIDAYGTVGGVTNGWAHKDYANDCGGPPPSVVPTPSPTPVPTPTPTPTPTPVRTPTPTPVITPTPTPTPAPYCVAVTTYRVSGLSTTPTTSSSSNWTLIPPSERSSIKPGENIYFCVSGLNGIFDKARFTINGVLNPETTLKRPGSSDFCQAYTIPTGTTSFTVKGELHYSGGWIGGIAVD